MKFTVSIVAMLAVVLSTAPSSAAPPPAVPPATATPSTHPGDDPSLVAAREEFKKGIAFAKDTQWVEALGAFERADALHSNATITFNVAICHRALGSYTIARDKFNEAIAAPDPGGLPQSLKEEARGNVAQIESLLVHARVTLDPPDALVSVDGRPLRQDGDAFTAGVLGPSPPSAMPRPSFELVMGPGQHLITVSKAGYGSAAVTRIFGNGEHTALPLSLSLLPATIHVSASQPDAVVTINGTDVGMAPVDISRHAGNYRVKLLKKGFEPYESEIVVKPGEEANLRAAMAEERTPLVKKWWFWTGAAAVVAGGVILTYELTRDPKPPPYNGGSAGWVVTSSGLRF